MSKKRARKTLQEIKKGLTTKEFLFLCSDMDIFFDLVADDAVLLAVYNVLSR